LSKVITKHSAGDESDVKVLMGGILAAFAGVTVDDYEQAAGAFVREEIHPTLGRRFTDCAYRPMIELLRYLEANGFTTYIASGGDRDFMRPITGEIYGVPPERVIGSSNALRYDEDAGTLAYLAQPDVFDDGPTKPVRIWSRTGRRPILAGGNSNGDVPMLKFAGRSGTGLALLVNHDDNDREFAYTVGAERALEQAADNRWIVVSVRNDWSTVFADGQPS
jgi:phosphoserine phosphatase